MFDRPFTWQEAQAAGLTRHELRTSRFRHAFRNVWVPAHLPDDRPTRLAATRLVLPRYAVICLLTAAWIYGGDVRRANDLDVHVVYPPGRRRRARQGVRVAQMTLAEGDVWEVDGLLVTSPTRTTFDCLRLLPDPAGILVADALTHRHVTDVDRVRSYIASQTGVRNVRRAALLVSDVEPLSESPMETQTRLRRVRGGLPRPQAQWQVFDAAGNFVARLDLAYPEPRVAVEYDGAWHWQRRREDDRRRDRLRALGWTVIVVSADDIFDPSSTFVADVARALGARAA